jgi:hypothetical protein
MTKDAIDSLLYRRFETVTTADDASARDLLLEPRYQEEKEARLALTECPWGRRF